MRKKILKYIEVAENIEKYIIRNHLKVGDKLPGGRYFTELFNTSKNTLYEAYGFLEDKNIISIEYKSGAVIKNIPSKRSRTDKDLDWNPYIKLGWQRQSSRSFQKIYNQAFDKSFMFFNASHLYPDFGYGRLLEESVKNVMERVRNTDLLSVCDNDIISSTGVTCADEWYVQKPYTDAALIAGMVYHMLDNTVDLATGQLKDNPWLDVDYLDTMVYGFFDSPKYKLNESDGTISTQSGEAGAGERNINEVPAGKSYCSWVLGNNSAAPTYSDTKSNYTANQYSTIDAGFKRWAPCAYNVKGAPVTESSAASSVYKTKQDYLTPKTPQWAELTQKS